MVRINFADVDYCLPCQQDMHRDCDRHMNDGAFDALDFIPVSCKCPCEGQITENFKLIDLVKRKADAAEAARQMYTDATAKCTRLQNALNELAELVVEALDDEMQKANYRAGSVIKAWIHKQGLEDDITLEVQSG